MKMYFLPIIYAAYIFSSEVTEQHDVEELLAINETITLRQEIGNVDLSSSNSAFSKDFQTPTPVYESELKKPWLAAGLSMIFPGLGQMYLGDARSASIMAGSAAASVGVVLSQPSNDNISLPFALALTTNSSYSTYAAYRDARTRNGILRYSYQMPMEGFKDLAYAPFQLSILKKPEVWGGVIGALALASLTTHIFFPDKGEVKIAADASSSMMPPLAIPIAIGEESLFRGFLQSAISENINPAAGLAISSLAFGAAHIPNALVLNKDERWRYYSFSLPLITAIGAYCGWLTQKNQSLKESVALHMWYDFIIFTAGALATHKAAIRPQQYAVSIPF